MLEGFCACFSGTHQCIVADTMRRARRPFPVSTGDRLPLGLRAHRRPRVIPLQNTTDLARASSAAWPVAAICMVSLGARDVAASA